MERIYINETFLLCAMNSENETLKLKLYNLLNNNDPNKKAIVTDTAKRSEAGDE